LPLLVEENLGLRFPWSSGWSFIGYADWQYCDNFQFSGNLEQTLNCILVESAYPTSAVAKVGRREHHMLKGYHRIFFVPFLRRFRIGCSYHDSGRIVQERLIVSGLSKTFFSVSLLNYDKTPRLSISSRRRESRRLEDYLQFFIWNSTWFVSSDASSSFDGFYDIHFTSPLTECTTMQSLLLFRPSVDRSSKSI
jgi:hypothetical protein